MQAPAISPLQTTAIAPRRISILGATGSIGDSTLRVIAQHPQRFHIAALTAHHNAEKLIALATRWRPALVAIGDESHASTLRAAMQPLGIRVVAGMAGLEEAAALQADITVAAIVGAAGLIPLMHAVAQGGTVAIANKEALVCAGPLVMAACQAHGTTLLPLDSEHNAIFQVLDATQRSAVEKITLTASGGPLLHTPLADLEHVTPEIAIKHPRWNMGAKISVDSATMMNKGLELIEAHYLFNMPAAQIDVLIHPESIVHSLVHYADGSVLAQLGIPDMAIPIAYALGWPERLTVATPRLDLAHLQALHFSAVDAARFPALGLARAALASGPAAMIALNAANEIAVTKFLARGIPFTAIAKTVAAIIEKTPHTNIHSIEDVLAVDRHARYLAKEYV